jgi:hypothetical protein
LPNGEVAACDGNRAIYLESGYDPFPCKDQKHVLVRGCDLYRMREWRKVETFGFGMVLDRAVFALDNIRFHTQINIQKFPNLHRVLPKAKTIRTRITLDPQDQKFLKSHLYLLDAPVGEKEKCKQVILECHYDGSVNVHSCPTREIPTTCLRLNYSRYKGDACVMTMSRHHLADILALGFLDIAVGDGHPLATATGKKYCWMPIESSILPLESERPTRPGFNYRSLRPSKPLKKPPRKV